MTIKTKIKKAIAIGSIGLAGTVLPFINKAYGGENSDAIAEEENAGVNSKPNELFIKAGYNFMNPKDYNAKIAEVSVGNGLGKASEFGIGYSRKLSILGLDTKLGMEMALSSQTIDKKVESILTGEQRVFGQESLSLFDIKPGIKVNSIADIYLGANGILEWAGLKSTNEASQLKETDFQAGLELNLSRQFNLGKFYLEPEIAYRIMINKAIDTSGLGLSIKAGYKF